MLVLNPQILLFSLVLGLDNDRFAMREISAWCLHYTYILYYIQHISNVTYDEY